MSENADWIDEVVLPALLRGARNTYGAAIRRALAEAGYDDVPKNGIYVIGGIARTGERLSELIKDLQVSKQSAGQLIDTLVARGYLERAVNPEDRRQLTITLTERGHATAAVSRAAVERVDAELLRRVGKDYIAHARRTLAALCFIGREAAQDESERATG